MEKKGDILETGLEEEKGATGKQPRCDDGNNRRNASGGRPTKHEERDGQKDASDDSYWQTLFRNEV